MDLGGPVNRHFQQTKNAMYQNSGYCDSRTNKQILIIDSLYPNNTYAVWTDNVDFSIKLLEPLRIDTLSDIYLDNFTTFGINENKSVVNDGTTAAKSNPQFIVLDIEQFNIKSNSNNPNMYNKIVIPNEETTTGALQIHKARKMNYMCSINPQTLRNISGKITGSNGTKIVDDATNFRFIAEFIIVAR